MTQKEKQIRMMHVVNLMSIAYADGNISEEENNVLVGIAQDLDLTEEEFNLCVEHWKETDEDKLPIAVPESDDEQIEFLKHFTLIMMIDGEITEKEKEFLAYVADTFGYQAEKVIPALIEDVYHEYFDNDNDNEDEENEEDMEDEEDEEDDPLFEDTDDEFQLDMGKMKLEGGHVEEAFDELFLPALRNPEAYDYFLIIPGIDSRLFRLSQEQLEKAEEAANHGYALAHYLLGRYHQVVKPQEDSLDTARQLLENAAEAGIPDARWALAMMYLYGYMGPVEIDEFNRRIDEAGQNGSMMAMRQRMLDTIHGCHGVKPDPKSAISSIETIIEEDEDNATKYPYLYDLLGEAYRKVGNTDKADKCFEKARELGYFESSAHRFENRVEGPDRDFYRETLSLFLDYGCEDNDPNSFLARALEHAWHYEQDEGEKQGLYAQKLREDLETAYRLGNGDAAYYLGLYSYTGTCGFVEDNQAAWDWFYKGQRYESSLAFNGMAIMIKDGIHPQNLPDGFLEFCRMNAQLRYTGEDQPAEMPTVFIVSPDGKATIYKLEKEEWHKLPHLIGSKRLAPLRLDALNKLAKKAGFNEYLVAWIDIDAPRKGLTTNTILKALYTGVVCGDVVFTLADSLYDPMPFFGTDEAKKAVKALKAKLAATVTDLESVSDEKQKAIDYSKVNPLENNGYVARIDSSGKATIVENSLGVFSLVEEDIYDPVRLESLYDLGKKLGLKGRLTLWTDNSAFRKEMVLYNKFTPNTVGTKYYPGPVADNLFVALEDENYRITLFDDPEQLKKVCAALGAEVVNGES